MSEVNSYLERILYIFIMADLVYPTISTPDCVSHHTAVVDITELLLPVIGKRRAHHFFFIITSIGK